MPKRPLKYGPYTVDEQLLRERLVHGGTTCEYPVPCASPAEFVYRGEQQVSYLCSKHHDLVLSQAPLRVSLESHMWDLFDQTFNFVRLNNDTFGAVLTGISATKKAATKDAKNAQRSATQARRDFDQWLRESTIKPGSPDDGTLAARGLPAPKLEALPPTVQVEFFALDLIQ